MITDNLCADLRQHSTWFQPFVHIIVKCIEIFFTIFTITFRRKFAIKLSLTSKYHHT